MGTRGGRLEAEGSIRSSCFSIRRHFGSDLWQRKRGESGIWKRSIELMTVDFIEQCASFRPVRGFVSSELIGRSMRLGESLVWRERLRPRCEMIRILSTPFGAFVVC